MITVSQFFKEENDPFFRRGEQRGEQRTKEMIVVNLLANTVMSVNQIADMAVVPVEFVEKLALTHRRPSA